MDEIWGSLCCSPALTVSVPRLPLLLPAFPLPTCRHSGRPLGEGLGTECQAPGTARSRSHGPPCGRRWRRWRWAAVGNRLLLPIRKVVE